MMMTHNPLAYLPDEALQDEVDRRRLARMSAWVTVGAAVPLSLLLDTGHFTYIGDTHSLVVGTQSEVEVVEFLDFIRASGDNFEMSAHVQEGI